MDLRHSAKLPPLSPNPSSHLERSKPSQEACWVSFCANVSCRLGYIIRVGRLTAEDLDQYNFSDSASFEDGCVAYRVPEVLLVQKLLWLSRKQEISGDASKYVHLTTMIRHLVVRLVGIS